MDPIDSELTEQATIQYSLYDLDVASLFLDFASGDLSELSDKVVSLYTKYFLDTSVENSCMFFSWLMAQYYSVYTEFLSKKNIVPSDYFFDKQFFLTCVLDNPALFTPHLNNPSDSVLGLNDGKTE